MATKIKKKDTKKKVQKEKDFFGSKQLIEAAKRRKAAMAKIK